MLIPLIKSLNEEIQRGLTLIYTVQPQYETLDLSVHTPPPPTPNCKEGQISPLIPFIFGPSAISCHVPAT